MFNIFSTQNQGCCSYSVCVTLYLCINNYDILLLKIAIETVVMLQEVVKKENLGK